MSAFICSNDHIQIIAQNYVNYYDGDIKKIFNELLRENIKSVNFRYCENTKKPRIKLNENLDCDVSKVQLFKLLDCLNYQSCEHSSYEKSKALKILKDLYAKIIPEICEQYKIDSSQISSLDDYNNSEWAM